MTVCEREQFADFKKRLMEARELPSFVFDSIRKLPASASPMDVLQASIPSGMADHELQDESREANISRAIRLIARIPMIVAGWDRLRNGHDRFRRTKRCRMQGTFCGTEGDLSRSRDRP